MIRIARDRTDEASVPIRPDTDWFERARQATEVAKREGRNHEARPDVYGHPFVRAALEKLFHDKCAYCESKIASGFDWEVEHFRPKGEVTERPDHSGYYWLAYEWSNLYPSCTHCNQRRCDKPRWGDDHTAETGGKASQFPLLDETCRAMTHEDDLAMEQALLLDPCSDEPAELLSFSLLGDAVSVGENIKATTTIEVFQLNRRRLRDARMQVVGTVLELVKLLSSRTNELADAARMDLRAWLLRHYLEDRCAYAGAARAVFRDPTAFGLTAEHQDTVDSITQ
jgi:uncharacterized protein (TIGR02646 family)